jgi:hypothetical protein
MWRRSKSLTRVRRAHRKAFAVFETLIGIPSALIGVCVLMSVGALGIVHTQVAIDARTKAWGGRHEPWKSSDLYTVRGQSLGQSAKFGQILGPLPRLNPNDVVVALGKRAVPLAMPGVFPDHREAGYWHVLLAGTWDHREIRFEPQSRHRRLEPTRKFTYFGGSMGEFLQIKRLLLR